MAPPEANSEVRNWATEYEIQKAVQPSDIADMDGDCLAMAAWRNPHYGQC